MRVLWGGGGNISLLSSSKNAHRKSRSNSNDVPRYTVDGHPGFIVVPEAYSLAEQLEWIVHCAKKYMYARTNITSAPSKGMLVYTLRGC